MNKIKIIILSITLLTIYILVFNYYLEKQNPKTLNPIINNIDTMNSKKIESFMYDNQIENFDYYNSFFTDSTKLSNQIKLSVIYSSLKSTANFNIGVSSNRFNTFAKIIFGEKETIKNEDILSTDENKKIMVFYDKTNDVYIKSNDYLEQNDNIKIVNHQLDFQIIKDKYILKQHKSFVLEKNNIFYVYNSLGDLKSNINLIYQFKNENIIKEVNDNYKINSQKYTPYKYTFTKENGNIILLKYEKE